MTLTTLHQESLLHPEGFYVPQFMVRVENSGLEDDVLRDVVQVSYKDSITEIDSFELTVNNWDPDAATFKYVGAETAASLRAGDQVSKLQHLFEPSTKKKVEVWMGYLGDLRLMVIGHFTTLEPRFPSGAAPTLTVRGLNVLHDLRRKRYTNTWTGRKDSQIAAELDDLRDEGKKRFPLPIVTEPGVLRGEPIIDYVAQNNQYDIDFLLSRARLRGYVVFVQEPEREGGQQRLYFGPSDGGQTLPLRNVTYELEWGRSLTEFAPTLSTATQVAAVTVTGWNRRTRERIRERVTIAELGLCNRDLFELLGQEDGREEQVVNEPVFTYTQARQRARAILRERTKEILKANGATVGLPDLRAGQRLRISGLGARFSGAYFVTGTTHSIGEGGYVTRFTARREEGCGGTA
jgi:uncharacterized protein